MNDENDLNKRARSIKPKFTRVYPEVHFTWKCTIRARAQRRELEP